MDIKPNKILIHTVCALLLCTLGACQSSFFEETQVPGLAGVWGSVYYSCSPYQVKYFDSVIDDWRIVDYPAVEFTIFPDEQAYTIFKFEGDEVWLMKKSPFVDSPAGVPYDCRIVDNKVYSPLFPPSFETEIYEIADLTNKTLRLIHIQQGASLVNPDSVIHGYKAEITFQRLK